MCKADELSIRKGVRSRSEFIPRQLKCEQKRKVPCIIPGCSSVSERNCGFMTYETICIACDVDCDEHKDVSADPNGSFLLCGQHYRVVHRYSQPQENIQCDLCGSRKKHRANVNRTWAA